MDDFNELTVELNTLREVLLKDTSGEGESDRLFAGIKATAEKLKIDIKMNAMWINLGSNLKTIVDNHGGHDVAEIHGMYIFPFVLVLDVAEQDLFNNFKNRSRRKALELANIKQIRHNNFTVPVTFSVDLYHYMQDPINAGEEDGKEEKAEAKTNAYKHYSQRHEK